MATYELENERGEVFTVQAPPNASDEELVEALEQAEIADENAAPTPGLPGSPASPQQQPGFGQQLGQAVRQAGQQVISQIPGVGAAQALSQAGDAVQRGVGTGLGAVAGSLVKPGLGTAAGAALGGQAVDAAQGLRDNPEQQEQILKAIASTTFKPGSPENIKALTDLFGDIDPSKAKDQAIKGGVDFAFGLLGGAGKAVQGAVPAAGPFTAAFKDPKLAFEGGRKAAFLALNKAKAKIFKGESIDEIARLAQMVSTKGGRQRLVNTLQKQIKDKESVSKAAMAFGREAAGKIQKVGGEAARSARLLKRNLTRQLERAVPGYTKALDKVREVFAVLGDPKAGGALTTALSRTPVNQALQTVSAPGIRRAAGAALGTAARGAQGLIPGAAGAVQGAVGNARQQVQSDGDAADLILQELNKRRR